MNSVATLTAALARNANAQAMHRAAWHREAGRPTAAHHVDRLFALRADARRLDAARARRLAVLPTLNVAD